MLTSGCGGRPDEGASQGVGQNLTAAPIFDWSVPDRLTLDGINWTSSPYVDKAQCFEGTCLNHTVDEVSPKKYTVNFDACANPGDTSAYRWTVEGDSKITQTADCKGFSYDFQNEGTFRVSLSLLKSSGENVTTTRDVTVQDWLIIGLGDSYGSGEGTPDEPIPESAWERVRKATHEFAQASLDLSNATKVLEIIQQVSGPVGYFGEKIQEANDAISSLARKPYSIPRQLHLAQATRRVFIAGGELVIALVPHSLELGLEIGLDPRDLYRKVMEAKTAAEKAVGLANEVILKDPPWKVIADILDGNGGGARWQDRQCHRSQFSAQAQAALELERSDPKTSVTFIPLACSGASSRHLVGEPYIGQESKDYSPLQPQLEVAQQLAGDREVDAVLLSVGGNDVGFGDIISACVGQEPCDSTGDVERGLGESNLSEALCTAVSIPATGIPAVGELYDRCKSYFQSANSLGQKTAYQIFQEARPSLQEQYKLIANGLNTKFPAINQQAHRVYITEYPDTSQTETGALCSYRADRTDPFLNLPGMSAREWSWAAKFLTADGLNAEIRTATQRLGWTYVGGIFGDYATHGYCSDQSWYARLQESLLRQGNVKGTLHPNRSGQTATASRIFQSLKGDLYAATGQPRLPRVANTPPALLPITGPADQVVPGVPVTLTAHVIDVADRHAGTWVWDDGTTSPAQIQPDTFGSLATGTHSYSAPGVYTVSLVVTDQAGLSVSSSFLFVVVVDPNAGGFRAQGTVLSPAGNFGFDPSLSGQVDVSLQARYEGEKVTPSGWVNFSRGSTLIFTSTFLEWLVVKGNRAEVHGFGSLNGVPEYDFYATGVDRGITGGIDGFRIKIWESWSGRVIYDNAPGQSDDLDVTVAPALLSGNVAIGKL